MDKKKYEIHLRLNEQQQGYFDACARIRSMTARGVVRELIEKICEDHLVAAILDDEKWHTLNTKIGKQKAPVINMEPCSDSTSPNHSVLTCPRCNPRRSGNNPL